MDCGIRGGRYADSERVSKQSYCKYMGGERRGEEDYEGPSFRYGQTPQNLSLSLRRSVDEAMRRENMDIRCTAFSFPPSQVCVVCVCVVCVCVCDCFVSLEVASKQQYNLGFSTNNIGRVLWFKQVTIPGFCGLDKYPKVVCVARNDLTK